MEKEKIITLFKNHRGNEVELSIIRDCTDDALDFELLDDECRYMLLNKQVALARHLLKLLPAEEAEVIEQHLICGMPWPKLAEEQMSKHGIEPAYDERTLLRLQTRGIEKISDFMRVRFQNKLDHLVQQSSK